MIACSAQAQTETPVHSCHCDTKSVVRRGLLQELLGFVAAAASKFVALTGVHSPCLLGPLCQARDFGGNCCGLQQQHGLKYHHYHVFLSSVNAVPVFVARNGAISAFEGSAASSPLKHTF